MKNKLRTASLVTSVSLIVLASACGGGSGKSQPAAAPSSPAAATQPAPDVTSVNSPAPGATTAAAATPAPAVTSATAAPSTELGSLAQNFSRVKSFRAAISVEGTSQQARIEYVAPDRMHLTVVGGAADSIELLSIGSEAYVKLGGTWLKQPGLATGGTLFDPRELNSEILAASADKGATKGRADSVNGKPCQAYSIQSESGSQEVCIADGLPARIVEQSGGTKTTIVFSDFNASIDIRAPI